MEGAHYARNNKNNNDKHNKELLQLSDIIQVFSIDVSKKIEGYNGKYVLHASYTINCAKDWNEYSAHINQFINEIEVAHNLDAIGIIIHMGKQMDLPIEQAMYNMYTALLYVHTKTLKYKSVKILLETSTGQGSEMCYKLEDFAYFFKKLIHHKNKEVADRFRVCLDTCHIFAAGYDIRTEQNITLYLEAFEELIGLHYIDLVHLNDSLNELGSNVDRHENLGKGHIGLDALLYIKKYFHNLGVAIVLETPRNGILYDLKLIKSIK